MGAASSDTDATDFRIFKNSKTLLTTKTQDVHPLMPSSKARYLFGLSLIAVSASATADCNQAVGRFIALEGTVEVSHLDSSGWAPAAMESALCQGDSIRVAANSRAAIQLANDATLRLDQSTTLNLTDVSDQPEKRSLLQLVIGAFKSFSRAPRTMTVNTPYVNGMVEGTEFAMRVGADATNVNVFEGKVTAGNPQGSLTLIHGQSATAAAGRSPQADPIVNPADAVQWTLYYPPVLLDMPGATSTDIQQRLRHASELLNVGRVDEARKEIETSLAAAPTAGTAYALRAMIAVVQNRREEALTDAKRAVELDDSAASRIALSYAQQATFQLDAAKDTLIEAATKQPDNALVHARLAELHLMYGEREAALAEAQRAQALSPSLAKPHQVLGFAALAANRPADAITEFTQAIGLAPADPLSHIGLGLTKIKTGALADGRRELEAGVALDGSNPLFRPYLGKAYYEEKRTPLDRQQYDIAKSLDPRDPTAYLYSAIEHQSANQPVAALHDLQKSIELNDNRAVYRSRLLLDSDLATRSASIARIYSDLGFQQRALVEGWKSVNLDASNYSAHRFLADTYSILPRHEIARVSELLQSQLLQPINATPIQPRLAESNLLLASSSGPAAVSFNEFNPVFSRDGLTLQANGLVGENRTYAGETVVSGITRNMSFSAGAYHYTTDGFRRNADQADDIANLFVQAALTPQTSVQGEYRYRDTTHGDLALRFFSDGFFPGERNRDEKNSYRLGLRHDFAPNSIILANFTYQEEDFGLRDHQPTEPFVTLIDLQRPDSAVAGEVQHLYRARCFSITSGVGYFDINSHIDASTGLDFGPPDVPFSVQSTIDEDARHFNAYVYSYLRPWQSLTVTLGGSEDYINSDAPEQKSRNQFNPKFGLAWEPIAGTTLRGAVFRTLKRTLITNQTLEPTQVAGFNQFYDEVNGTEAWRYGLAIDQQFTPNVYAGLEASVGDLSVPFLDFSNLTNVGPAPGRVSWKDALARGYLFWTPNDWLALRTEYQYERARRDRDASDGVASMDTHRVPIGASVYFAEGFSSNVQFTYVHQHGKFETIDNSAFLPGSSSFGVLDASLSYRLPKRYGFVSVGASNLLDRHFKYFDTDRNNPWIQPTRAVFARITLAWP